MKLIVLFTLLLLTACSNKNQPLDDITLFQEKLNLCIGYEICKDGMTKESIIGGRKEIKSEYDRLELIALRDGFTMEQIDAAIKIGESNAKEIAKLKKSE